MTEIKTFDCEIDAKHFLNGMKADRIPFHSHKHRPTAVEVVIGDDNTFCYTLGYPSEVDIPDVDWWESCVDEKDGMRWFLFEGDFFPEPQDRVAFDAEHGWAMFTAGEWHKASMEQCLVYLRGHGVENPESVIASAFDKPQSCFWRD